VTIEAMPRVCQEVERVARCRELARRAESEPTKLEGEEARVPWRR
jgi:hypothetical protein